MPDGDVIDSLSLEIGASVNKSIDAIDQLQSKLAKLNGALGNYLDDGKYVGAIRNLTSGFTELDNSISDDVVSKVASLAKSLNTLSSSADKVGKSFSTVTKYPETLNEHVSKNLGDLFAQFGIKGEENIKRVTNGFIELENVAASGGSTNNAMDGLISDIQELSNVAVEGTKAYEGLVDAVNNYLSNVKRIHVDGDDNQFRDYDFIKTIGTIAGGNAKKFTSKPGGVNFQEFAHEINDQFHVFPEEFFEGGSIINISDFAEVMKAARAEMNGFAEDSKKIKPSADEVFVAISEQTEAVRQAMSSFQDTGVETTLSPIERIIPELQNLSGVAIPDFTNLATLAKSVGTLGNDKSTVASDNIPKIVQGLQPLSAGFAIPDFTSLATMASAVAKLGNDASTTATTNIPVLANGLKTLDGVKIPDFANLGVLANATSKLGNANSQNAAWVLPNIMSELESFSQHFSGLTIDAGALNTIQQLGSAFSKLGGKNANEAIKTLPQLSDAIRQMVEDLNTLPEVSDKTQQLVVALGNLAKANGKAQTAATGTNSAYGMLSKTMQGLSGWVIKNWKNTNVLKSAITALGSGVKNYNAGMNSAKAHTESLTGAIIKVRSIIWGLKRVMGFFSEAVGNASSLTEVMNVVENVYDASYIEEFNKATQNTIETLGMSELTFKQFASRYQAMGKAMGITNSQMQGAEDHLKSMGIEYGVTTGKMGDMSVNLTRLAADMASFYDVAQEDVYTSLQAIYTGQTRPLRQYGIDLTQATLKEWAMKQGLDADIESMTQAQKTMLRYQYVMQAARSAMNDFSRTSDTWHNQTVILKESIKALGVVIGQGLINALKPALKGFNTFLSSTIDFAQNVLNALGKIFGWEYEITGGGIADDTLADVADMASDLEDATGGADSLGDSIGDVGDGIGEATKAADKLKNTILGFDELNVLNDVADALDDIGSGGNGSGSGSGKGTGTGNKGAGVGGASGGASDPIQLIAKKTKSAFESSIDNLYDLGKYISDSLKKALDDIEWNKVYEKARNFGKGLAQFLNGLIQPETFYAVGRTLANSLNTVVEAALAFTREFDWKKAGKSLEQGFIGLFKNINWKNIYALADELGRNLANYLNNLFTPELFSEAGRTLANSLNTVFRFLDNFGHTFEWEQFGKSLSEGLASFVSNIHWEEALSAAKEWGTGIATALNSFIESGDENKWREVGRTVGNAVKTGLIAVISLTSEIHWDEVGQAVSDVINGALDNISGEDVAEAINGLVEGLNEAIGICKDNGTFDRIGDEIGDAIKNIHWDSVIELLANSAMLDLAVGMATGLAGWFGQNPVKGILEGGVGVMGNILSMAIAMKIAGVGAVGGGGAVATASAAGTAISTSLAGGIILGGVAVAAAGLIIAGIVSAATYQWQDESVHGMATMGEEIAVRLGLISENWLRENKRVTDGEELMYRDLLNQAREHGYEKATIWDETTGKLYQITEDANGKIEKKEVELWNNTDSVFSDGQQKAIGHVKELWDANTDTTTSGTQDALDLIRGYSNTHANEFNTMKEGVVGTTQDMWASAAETTGTYTAQIESDVETSTSNVLSSAETNLGQLPGIFDSYFGQGTDNALWHLGNFESSASSILSNVTSWLYDAINTANQASSISIGPVAHWGGHYAEGGFPDSGTLFMARENASPEMVGRIGTRTAVANNDQIVAGIRAGVMDGMMQVLTATSSGGGSQPIVNEITVTCGEETLYQAVVRGKEKHDRRFQTVATIG